MTNVYDEIEAKTERSPLSDNIYDRIENGESAPDESPSAVGALSREAARSVVPGVAGTLAGAGAGALAGARTGSLAPVAVPLFALAGGIAAGMGVRKLQDVAADKVAPESFLGTKSAQADAEAQPVASFAGSLLGMGKPSFSALGGSLRAIGTAEGRAGVATVAKSLVNKEARTALTKAAEQGDQAARKSLESFGHAVGGAAGVGTQAGMEIAQGEDPLTAAAKGVAGLAVKPWAGPGGVFLDPMRPPKMLALNQPETPAAPEDVPADTPATPEEQQLIDDALAGKVRAVEATEQAANVAEATGTLPQTAAALRKQARRTAAKPVTAPVPEAAPEVSEPVQPTVTDAARAYAEKLGVDVSQVAPNKFGKVTKADINKWRKANPTPPPETETAATPAVKTEQPEQPANDNLAQRNWMLTRAKEIARQKDQPFTNFSEWAAANPDDFNQMAVEWRALQEGTKKPAPAPAPAQRPAADPELDAAVSQAKTAEEFEQWASGKKLDSIRPPEGGVYSPRVYWSLRQPESPVAPAAPESKVAPPVAPIAAAPEASAAAPETVVPKPQVAAKPPVQPEEPPLIVDEEPIPYTPRRNYPGVTVQNVSNSQLGISLSPSRQTRFPTIEEAERSFGDFDRVKLKDFFERVHSQLASGVNTSSKARTPVMQSDAIVGGAANGFGVSSMSRYSGAESMNWMKTLESLKSAASNTPVEMFRQRSGGASSLLEVATNTEQLGYVGMRLSENGINNATLVRDADTGMVKAYLLVKDPAQYRNALEAFKKFAYENNYERIKVYKGDSESVGANRDEATALLRESLGQYTSGGSRGESGGTDRLRVANSLWELAREAGIELGERPASFEDPNAKASNVSNYEVPLAEQQAADAKIPPKLEAKYSDLLTRASYFLDRALGLTRLQLIELGQANNWPEGYMESLLQKYDEGTLVPDVVPKLNANDETRSYGVNFASNQPFADFAGYYRSFEALKNIVLGKVRVSLADTATQKPLPKPKTKANAARLAELDKKIEALENSKKELKRAQKTELKNLRQRREELTNQISPWTLDGPQFEKYVEDKLKNAIKSVGRVETKRTKAGLGEVEDTVLTGEDKESKSLTEGAAAEESDPNAAIGAEVKKAAYTALRDNEGRLADRVAVAVKISEGGFLNESEWKALSPDISELQKELDASDRRASQDPNRTSVRELGQAIAKSYTLEEILQGKHRRKKDGALKRGTYRSPEGEILLSPMEESATIEREAPPQVLRETSAREFLSEMLESKSISSEDSAFIRRLVDEANLDNIPLRIYDYLEGAYGSYNRRSGEVAVNFEMMSPDRNVETGLHEIGHALLGYFLNPKNATSLNARQKKIVGDLYNFYEQTTEAAIREGKFTREQLEAVRKMQGQGDVRLSSNEERAAYRYSNVDEWTAAMMSNAEFRDYMKGLKTRDFVTGKLRQAWETFKDLVARLFGVDRSVYRQSFDKIMELALDSEAGRVSGVAEGPDTLLRPAGESARFTKKVSTAEENERLAPEDQVLFDSQKVPQAKLKAMEWKSNGGRFEDLLDRNVPLSDPEIMQAAALFRDEAAATKVALAKKADPDARDIRAKQVAENREREANQLLVRMKSGAGQVLGHGQHLENDTGVNIQEMIKTLLGKTPEQMAEGKIDLQRMMQGIRDIKAQAAKTTVDALRVELERIGITNPEDLKLLQDNLSHTSTTFKDVVNTLASMLPANNAAQARAMAERIYRLYAVAANAVSKRELPTVVNETYNGESIIPAGDKFLRKLNEYIKIGKYNEDEINATLLESLGLSGYDTEFIKGIRKDIDKMMAMPEGDMRSTASVEILQKVRTKLVNNILKNPLSSKESIDTVREMIVSAWQSGVLSGPPTGMVNLLASNLSVATETMMEAAGFFSRTGDVRYFADAVGGFLSAVLGNKSTGREAAARTQAFAALSGRGTRYRNAMREEMPILENIDTTGASLPVKILGGHAKNLRWVGRIMSSLDAINMTMADEAMQRMAARFFLSEVKGHKSSEVTDMMHKLFDPDEVIVTDARRQAEAEVRQTMGDRSAKEQERWVTRRTLEILTQRREEVVPGISEAGVSAAERFTYNETAKGLLGKLVVGLSSQINQNVKEGRFVFSFMNTLVNIMNQTLDYSPYGFLRAKNWSLGQRTLSAGDKYAPRVYREGSPEQLAQIARAYLGTTVMMALGYLAYKGREDEENGRIPYFTVTGAGPKNPYDRQQLIDTQGWRPNSVKIGDTWFRYIDIPIIGSALGFLGTTFDNIRYKKDEQTEGEAFSAAIISALTTILDKQLLQGANNFFQMLRGGQPGQQVYSAKRLVGGTVAGFTNPGVVRWLRNTLDMDGEGNVSRLDQSTTEGWIASMIPFSIGYDTPALNVLGEPIKQPWYSATTWRFADFNNLPKHPIITPLVQAGLMLPNPSPSTQFTIPDPSNGTLIQTRMGKYPEVMRRFVELRGQYLKKMLTPERIAGLQRAALRNKDNAQDYLDSDIGGAAREAAVRQVEKEIRDGKLKI